MFKTRKVTAEIFSILIVPAKKRDNAVASETRRRFQPVTFVTRFELPPQSNTPAEATIKILQ